MHVIDIDRHVIEPQWMWRQYLPAAYRDSAPAWVASPSRAESLGQRLTRLGERALLPVPAVLAVEGRPVWRGISEAALIEMGVAAERRMAELQAAQTADGHLDRMTEAGVTMSMLLPTYAPYLVYDDEASPQLSAAYADAYNRWLADLCAADRKRLAGAVLLSRSQPRSLVDALERGLAAGLSAAVIRGEPVRGLALSASAYEPLWAACASASVALLIHGGSHARLPTAGGDRFETHFGQHMCSHPLEAMMALVALLEAGVFERHPTLRVGLLECGSGWLPSWLGRLDAMWRYCRSELRGRVERPPSEIFRRQCFIAVEPAEAMLRETVAELGAQNLVFGSDYPHLDHPTKVAQELAGLRETLGDTAARQVLEANPRRLLGLGASTDVRARAAPA